MQHPTGSSDESSLVSVDLAFRVTNPEVRGQLCSPVECVEQVEHHAVRGVDELALHGQEDAIIRALGRGGFRHSVKETTLTDLTAPRAWKPSRSHQEGSERFILRKLNTVIQMMYVM